MTTKDELNGQTEKRTDKKDETLDRAEELKKELVFRWGFQRGEPVWDLFKNELDEYAEAYYKYRVNAISDEMIDKIIEDGIWGFPEDKAGDFMVKQLKDFAKNIISKLNE